MRNGTYQVQFNSIQSFVFYTIFVNCSICRNMMGIDIMP